MTVEYYPSPANQNKAPEVDIPKRHNHRDWSGATVGLVFGLAGLFGARLGQLWIGFDIFAQFWMQFLFITFASALGLASPRYKSLVAMVLLCLMVVGYSVWPYYVSAEPHPQLQPLRASERQIKVASFNTFLHNSDYNAIAQEVIRLDPDVITLVEFGPDKAKALDLLHQKFPFQENCWKIIDCDFAILSKTPLTDISAMAYWDGPPFMSATLGSAFGNLTVVGLHTDRFPRQRAQLKQMLAFVKRLEQHQGRMIVMGDINATPFSRITKTLVDGLNLDRLTYLPTWSASYGFPQLAIDHIFVSAGIHALDRERIGEYAGSDHFPITMTLAIPISQ